MKIAYVLLFSFFCIQTQLTLELPELMGVAISEYQNSGSLMYQKICNDEHHKNNGSNWSDHEKENLYDQTVGSSTKMNCAFLCDYTEYIKTLKDMHCNSIRISIEWAFIEPLPGVFCQKAIALYHEIIDAFEHAGITVMITMHHFTHPRWFEKMGGFENNKIVKKYFDHFCVKMFSEFQHKIKLFGIINEIAPFAFQGYITGVFPPAKHNIHSFMKVTRNMLDAHCRIYKKCRALDPDKNSHIGFIHNMMEIETFSKGFSSKFNMLEQLPVAFMNYVFNNAILNFLKTGDLFSWHPLYKLHVADSSACFDFFGLNFYGHVVAKSGVKDAFLQCDPSLLVQTVGMKNEYLTDMRWAVCPQAFKKAIKKAANFNVPIYITENGVEAKNDSIRQQYLKDHLNVVSKALKMGINIKGYYHWTLFNNFEWNHGYTMQFGLGYYDVKNKQYILKDSGILYQKILSNRH